MRVIPIIPKNQASAIVGGLTQTSKMPCKSYSLPTIACQTGFKMAQIKGSVCASCYAMKGFYSMYANTIEPAQHARLVSIDDPLWVDSMVNLIGTDEYFRWLDSGDIQSVAMLRKIALVCEATPDCGHWLPTREYGMVKSYIAKFGVLPRNLTIRLSAMFPDKPVAVPLSLRDIPGVTVSNVHSKGVACAGQECEANKRGGKCGECRACWNRDVPVVSYQLH